MFSVAEIMWTDSLTLYDLVSDTSQWEDRIAVLYDGGDGPVTMTYQQMMAVSEVISSVIGCYVQFPAIIGLCIEPSQFMPAVIIGVLRSGNAFLNIPTSGTDYVQSVIDRLGITMILVQSSQKQTLVPLITKYKVTHVQTTDLHDMDIALIMIQRQEEVVREWATLAYAITTSGTTGKPKIVRVPHRCIVPNVLYQRKIFGVTEEDVVFLSSPLTFDPSIVEIFIALSRGACLLITSEEVKMVPRNLMLILMKYKVSVMQCTPTLLLRFNFLDLQTELLSKETSLRVLGLGGEKFPSLHYLHQWRAPGNKTTFYNLYGITEVSCWSSIYQVTEEDIRQKKSDVPIGEPITGTKFVVKDREGHIVNHGKGSLCIESCTRVCYIDDEAPSIGNEPLLRMTGDIVSVQDDGRIVFIGREDSQVKRNGKRIDLTQIEQVISKDMSVHTARVLYKDAVLVAVIVLKSDICSHHDDWHSHLKKHIQSYLPSHSWPEDILLVGNLPITKHGKCDADSLWRTVHQQRTKSINLPFNMEYLQQIWKDQLSCDIVCADDLFIQNGGDSIQALHLANQIQSGLGLQFPWLLDFILHKPFSEIFEKLTYEINQHKGNTIFSSGNNHNNNGQKTNFISNNSVHSMNDSKNSSFNKLARKRKLHNGELLSSGSDSCIDDVSTSPSAKISCKLMFISRCNRCFDWSLCEDDTISGFKSSENIFPQVDFKSREDCSDSLMTMDDYTEDMSCDVGKPCLADSWKYDTMKCVDASPLIASLRDGTMVVYIGSHSHRFSAVLLDTGQLLWETTLGDRIESSACMTLCGQYIVVGCYDYNVYTMNSHTGDIIWTYQTGGEVKSSPVVDPITSLVIFGSHDQKLHAVNIQDRAVAWWADIATGSIFASPSVSRDPHMVTVATLGGSVVSVNAESGTLLWQYNCGKPVFSSPAITDRGICVGCVDGCVYQLDFKGQLLWTFRTEGPIFSSPTYMDERIFIGSHDCHMYCLNVSGDLLWKVKVKSAVYSSAFCFTSKTDCSSKSQRDQDNSSAQITDISTYNSYITFASSDGVLYITDALSGGIISSFTFPGEIFSSPVTHKNCLVVGCRNNFLYCLKIW